MFGFPYHVSYSSMIDFNFFSFVTFPFPGSVGLFPRIVFESVPIFSLYAYKVSLFVFHPDYSHRMLLQIFKCPFML